MRFPKAYAGLFRPGWLMISEAEILHIISEVHQYDIVLVELRDGTAFGILKGTHGKPRYFQIKTTAHTPQERRAMIDLLVSSGSEHFVDDITLETLLNGLRGMKPRRVWLERRDDPAHEMAFLSLRELEAYLRKQQV
jgi:hypothetical protein